MSEDVDYNGDGKVTEQELNAYARKMRAQRNIAGTSLAAIIIFTALLMSPLVDVQRVTALSDLFSMFYVMMAGVVGAYMGVSAWMGRK